MFSPFGGGFDMMFSIVPVLVGLGFVAVLTLIIVQCVRGAKQWKTNNDSPILTVEAMVVAKRADVQHHHHHDMNGGMDHMTSSTDYYVTFQVESGSRMELKVSGGEYGMLAEGDRGKLTFQGTRYQGFQR